MWSSWFFGVPCGFVSFHLLASWFLAAVSHSSFNAFYHLAMPGSFLTCFPFLSCVSFILFVFQDDEFFASQFPSIVELCFRKPIDAFPYTELLLTCKIIFRPQIIKSGGCLTFCKPHPGPHLSFKKFLIQSCELRESCLRVWQSSIHIDIQKNIVATRPNLCDLSLVTSIFQWCCSSFGTWSEVRRDDDKSNSLRHLLFRLLVETSPNFPESLLGRAFEWPLGLDGLFQIFLLFHPRLGGSTFSSLFGVMISFYIESPSVDSTRVQVFPTPQCLQPKFLLSRFAQPMNISK